jgi:hypothetical protein
MAGFGDDNQAATTGAIHRYGVSVGLDACALNTLTEVAAGSGLVQRGAQVPRAGAFGQHHPVGDAAGHRHRLRAANTRQHRRRLRGWLREQHVVQMHFATVVADALAAQEHAYDGDHLLQRRERAGGARSHLPHPLLHTVADAGDDAAGSEAGKRGQLHRGDSRVARDRWQDAEAHVQALGTGQR